MHKIILVPTMPKVGEGEIMSNNAIINNSALNTMISNKGWSTRRLTLDDCTAIKEWHALLDELLVCAYEQAQIAHDGIGHDLGAVFDNVSKVWNSIEVLQNGAQLRFDADTALTIAEFLKRRNSVIKKG